LAVGRWQSRRSSKSQTTKHKTPNNKAIELPQVTGNPSQIRNPKSQITQV